MKVTLGISSGFHDSAVALVDKNGSILFASSEERFSRKKGDKTWPNLAINAAINYASENSCIISCISYYENPFKRLLWCVHHKVFSGKYKNSISIIKSLEQCKNTCENLLMLALRLNLSHENIRINNHHVSHAHAAFCFGNCKPGLVLILDAFGENCSGFLGYVNDQGNIKKWKILNISQSVGLFYSSVTAFCGFKVLTGEYKLMGLAPYGKPKFFDDLVSIFGEPRLASFNTSLLDPFVDNLGEVISSKCNIKKREPESDLSETYLDFAASAQIYLEKLLVDIVNRLTARFKDLNLCNLYLGGGVALNCKSTYVLHKHYPKHNIIICPAAGDSGSAIGTCISSNLEHTVSAFSNSSIPAQQKSAYLGTAVSADEITLFCSMYDIPALQLVGSDHIGQVVNLLKDGKVGSIFRGKSEFGPRALGNRSIIANPQDKKAIRFINTQIKSREDFRPLAPITTREIFNTIFDKKNSSNLEKYMLTLFDIPESIANLMPSAVHVDSTARLQVIDIDDNIFVYEIIKSFYLATGCPALINTSFNQRGEPIVESLKDAFTCFCSTDLDFLVLGEKLIIKEEVPEYVLDQFALRVEFDLD